MVWIAQKTLSHLATRAVKCDISGVREHGMQLQYNGERGRSWSFFEGKKYRRTSLKREDVEKTIRESEGS